MGNFLSTLQSGVTTGLLSGISSGIFDSITAYRTPSDKSILKASGNGGQSKYSAVMYPNGTLVETITHKANR